MKQKMDDQENIKRLREIVEPCQRCGGRGYVVRMMTHPRDGLVEEREFCGCINANLPIPKIKDGRLNFKMERNNQLTPVSSSLQRPARWPESERN